MRKAREREKGQAKNRKRERKIWPKRKPTKRPIRTRSNKYRNPRKSPTLGKPCASRIIPRSPSPGSNGVAAGLPPSRMSDGTLVRSELIGAARLCGPPLPPMGRPHVQPFLGLHFHPAVENAAAREHERMRAVIIDDGQLKVALERCGGYLLPHRVSLATESSGALT